GEDIAGRVTSATLAVCDLYTERSNPEPGSRSFHCSPLRLRPLNVGVEHVAEFWSIASDRQHRDAVLTALDLPTEIWGPARGRVTWAAIEASHRCASGRYELRAARRARHNTLPILVLGRTSAVGPQRRFVALPQSFRSRR